MPKLLSRIVAVFLIPCLIVDWSLASGMTHISNAQRCQTVGYEDLFLSQSLNCPTVTESAPPIHRLDIPLSAKLRRWATVMLALSAASLGSFGQTKVPSPRAEKPTLFLPAQPQKPLDVPRVLLAQNNQKSSPLPSEEQKVRRDIRARAGYKDASAEMHQLQSQGDREGITEYLANPDPYVYSDAVTALSELGDPRAIDLLIQILETGSVQDKEYAVVRLVNNHQWSFKAMSAVLKAWRDPDQPPSVREKAKTELYIQFGFALFLVLAVGFLTFLLIKVFSWNKEAWNWPWTRWSIRRHNEILQDTSGPSQIREKSPGDITIEDLNQGFALRNPQERQRFIDDLVGKGPGIVPILLESIALLEGPAQQTALQAFDILGRERSVPFLLGGLRNPSISTRRATLQALNRIKWADAQASEEDQAYYRLANYLAYDTYVPLEEFAARALPALVSTIQTADSACRTKTIEFVRQQRMHDPEVLQAISAAYSDPNRLVRHMAIIALRTLGNEEQIPIFVAGLVDRDSTIRLNSAMALKTLGWTPPTRQMEAYYHVAYREWDEAIEMGRDALPAIFHAITGDWETGNFELTVTEASRAFLRIVDADQLKMNVEPISDDFHQAIRCLIPLHPEWVSKPPSFLQLRELVSRVRWLPPLGGKIPLIITKTGSQGSLKLEPSLMAEQHVQTILNWTHEGKLGQGYVHHLAVQGRLPDAFKYVAIAFIMVSPYRQDWKEPYYQADWGKVAPLVHDGGNVMVDKNPIWQGVPGRTDFLERIRTVRRDRLEHVFQLMRQSQVAYMQEVDRRVLHGGSPAPSQTERILQDEQDAHRKALDNLRQAEQQEWAMLAFEAQAYQRLALACHCAMGTAPNGIPPQVVARLAQRWSSFQERMERILSRNKLSDLIRTPWFLETPRQLWGLEKRHEADGAPVREALNQLENTRWPQRARGPRADVYEEVIQILQSSVVDIDRDIGLLPPPSAAGMAAGSLWAQIYQRIPDWGILMPLRLLIVGFIVPLWETFFLLAFKLPFRLVMVSVAPQWVLSGEALAFGMSADLNTRFALVLQGIREDFEELHSRFLFVGRQAKPVQLTEQGASARRSYSTQVKAFSEAFAAPFQAWLAPIVGGVLLSASLAASALAGVLLHAPPEQIGRHALLSLLSIILPLAVPSIHSAYLHIRHNIRAFRRGKVIGMAVSPNVSEESRALALAIKQARNAKAWSQFELSKRAEITPQTVYRAEQRGAMSEETARGLAKALGLGESFYKAAVRANKSSSRMTFKNHALNARLLKYRKDAGLTQWEVCRRTELNVNPETIYRIENNLNAPTFEILLELGKVYNFDAMDLWMQYRPKDDESNPPAAAEIDPAGLIGLWTKDRSEFLFRWNADRTFRDRTRVDQVGRLPYIEDALDAGIRAHRAQVVTALDEHRYQDAIARGTMTRERVIQIIRSARLQVPRDIAPELYDRPLATIIEELPPLKAGFVRMVHLTARRETAEEIARTGLDYKKYGMVSSTAHSWADASKAEYYADDPRFENAQAAVVMDVPSDVQREHERPEISPGLIPAEYMVGIVKPRAALEADNVGKTLLIGGLNPLLPKERHDSPLATEEGAGIEINLRTLKGFLKDFRISLDVASRCIASLGVGSQASEIAGLDKFFPGARMVVGVEFVAEAVANLVKEIEHHYPSLRDRVRLYHADVRSMPLLKSESIALATAIGIRLPGESVDEINEIIRILEPSGIANIAIDPLQRVPAVIKQWAQRFRDNGALLHAYLDYPSFIFQKGASSKETTEPNTRRAA